MSSNFNYFRLIYFCLGHVLGTRNERNIFCLPWSDISRSNKPLHIQDGDHPEKRNSYRRAVWNPSVEKLVRDGESNKIIGKGRVPATRIFSRLAVAGLSVTIGRYWYLFKRLTPVSAGRFYRFEHIVTYSSGKVVAK